LSFPDPLTDRLLTAENAVLLIVDFQPPQISTVATIDRVRLVENAAMLCRAARLFRLPIILSTLKRRPDGGPPTVPEIVEIVPDAPPIVRTTLNPWEDDGFLDAVTATGRRKLIFAGLWTEAVLSFAVLSAIQDGYDVYIVLDAIGGTSDLAHAAALSRMSEAGANQTSCVQVICELQRDCGRTSTVDEFLKLLRTIKWPAWTG
jgi:nicotinamidase-related amidase